MILSGLNSRPELNGRYARVQGGWPRGRRYLPSVRPTDGATAALMIKVKPGNATAAGDEAPLQSRRAPTMARPRPREAWAYRPSDKPKSSLQACFEQAGPSAPS